MSLLKNLTTDSSIEDEKDILGGGGVVDSGAYPAVIKLAYASTADSGAIGITIHFELEGGRKYQTTEWVQSGNAKGNKNFYEKDGKKYYLPGFITVNSICLLTVGKELGELDTEEKVANIYDYDAKKELPTKVQAITELHGQEVLLGLLKEIVDKTVKEGNEYVPTGETREQNVINKVFRASDNFTTTEIRASADEPVFYTKWVEKNTGQVVDRSSKNAKAGAPAGAAAQAPERKKSSIFSNAQKAQ